MSHEPQCYVERAEKGFFSQLEAKILALDPKSTFATGTMTYNTTFVRRYFPPDKEGGFAKTLYYHVCDDGRDKADELGLIFFGEICPASMGTMLSAKGNHYTGKYPKPIDDNTVVKDILVLRTLTGGTTVLNDAYENQLFTLEEILEEDRNEREKYNSNLNVTGFFATPNDESGRPTDDRILIKITLPQKYRVPPDVQKTILKSQRTRTKKNLLQPKSEDDGMSDPETLRDPTENQSPAIEVGRFYPLEMLPDHRGDYFQQEHAKLVQLEMLDTDEKLIPPWEAYDKLRVGTVVLVETTLVCWHIPDHAGGSGTTKKLVYQVQGHRLRILSESDELVEPRDIPAPIRPSTEPTSTTSPRKKPSSAFTEFQSPSKKLRHD
ncbi:hypothetical protein GALMADRAFT_225196 [Galerina marginata CBS 339.88]|uniref:Uncharacterized protein n=1 Tax=Galerina marginata (strain CBS 339.88) TaxID=685588 RepID=A0A067T1R1_GALM3|nr:hypothetical protein GALMADRAFT_225196 [Galerina marginata CBS 339.88]